MKTYNALDLAKYIVKKCIDDGCPISNLQLQKILYYIQREALREGNPAFLDEIQAWKFGPAVSEVFYFYCIYGAVKIFDAMGEYMVAENDAFFIDKITEEKRKLNPWDMVQDIHAPGKAWDRVFRNGKGRYHEIPRELIKNVG